MTPIRQIRKRDGRVVPFRREKIADAIYRAARAVGGEDRFLAEELAGLVVMHLEGRGGTRAPGVEAVQDLVEKVLIETGHARTAKAYILYRDRRAAARQARAQALGGARMLIGGEGPDDAEGFSKAGLVEALIEADDLPRHEAEDVAREVEARILRSTHARIPTGLLEALTRTVLFERGQDSRIGEREMVGVDRDRIRVGLGGLPGGGPVEDPASLARDLGESLLEDHVLREVLPPAVAEAHRLGDLHLLDLGQPVGLTATALPVRALLARHLCGETISRPGGPRLIQGAFGRILDRYRPFVTRTLALEHVNVYLAPFLSHLDEDALAEEVRQWLLQPALRAFPERGGRKDLELGLAAEVPGYLARLEPPDPAPPGRPYGAYGDVAREIARLFVREGAELRRRARGGGPRLTLVLPREGQRDASARALLREALEAAAEVGEPRVVFEDLGAPSRGHRWLRRRETEVHDPFRFLDGDLTAGSATALNLVAAALRTRDGGPDAFVAETERLLTLAVDGAVARRDLLARAGDEPGRALYALRRGPVPLVDLDACVHLVELVGLDRALVLLGEGAAGLGDALLDRVRRHLAQAGTERGLDAQLATLPDREAEHRFARLDAARYGEAASWWSAEATPTYAAPDPRPGEVHRDAWSHRVRHRIDAEAKPPVDDLLALVEAAAGDVGVVEYALEPWPHRWVRREGRGP